MSNQATTQTYNDQIIHYMLKALEASVDQMKENVGISQQMYSIGITTDLTSNIKQLIENPMSQLLMVKDDMDKTISSFLTSVVKKFFEFQSALIQKAVRTETGNNHLHFSIVLKEDNEKNRGIILAFLRDYKYTNIWESFPIYFQFVPKNIEHKIIARETLL